MKVIRQYLIHISLVIYITATAMPLLFWGVDGVFPKATVASVFLIILLTFFHTIKQIKRNQIISLFYLLFLFLFTSTVFVDGPVGASVLNEYFQFFMISGIGALIVTNYNYNYELFLRSLIIVSIIVAPNVISYNYSSLSYDVHNDEWMFQIYAITPYLVGSIHYIFVGENNLFKILSFICLVLFFPMFIMHTPRGAVVTIIMSVMVFILQNRIANGIKQRALILWMIALIIGCILISDVIVSSLQKLSDTYELRWLAKFVYEEDISNNRYPLYAMAWEGFLDSPIWGNGIATFNNFDGYPHNLFLQMLYETGLLMIIPFVYILIKTIKTILSVKRTCNIDYRFVTFYFLISINQLMFSSYFWRNQSFWMMTWIMLAIIGCKKDNVIMTNK